MQLSKKILPEINSLAVPAEDLFTLPEKVLQFGTGVFLRGLPDYVIDKANKQGIFNGRVVVIKSTGNGGTDAFAKQDGLYTLFERGIENGSDVDRSTINAAISRVLSADETWEEILACVSNPAIQVIISNTTEVGITLVESDAHSNKPVSYPGRLLAILEKRYISFNGNKDAGMVIVPTELIVDNGDALKNIVVALAMKKGLSSEFIHWLTTANEFCNSLVDRIVPGKLPKQEQAAIETKLGYADELMIMAEPYCFWAIETKTERAKNILSFSEVEKGVILTNDINKFRELKLRLLNGAHTFSCGIASLAGFVTVKQAMNNAVFAEYISALMLTEIAPLVAGDSITENEAVDFAMQVLDRFRNPYIEHQWMSIAVQYTSKMAMRTAPLIAKHFATNHGTPELMALGFAAHILFTKPVLKSGDAWYGNFGGAQYPIPDDKAELLQKHWHSAGINSIVSSILSDTAIYGDDLTQYNGFTEAVQLYLASMIQNGVVQTLQSITVKQPAA